MNKFELIWFPRRTEDRATTLVEIISDNAGVMLSPFKTTLGGSEAEGLLYQTDLDLDNPVSTRYMFFGDVAQLLSWMSNDLLRQGVRNVHIRINGVDQLDYAAKRLQELKKLKETVATETKALRKHWLLGKQIAGIRYRLVQAIGN